MDDPLRVGHDLGGSSKGLIDLVEIDPGVPVRILDVVPSPAQPVESSQYPAPGQRRELSHDDVAQRDVPASTGRSEPLCLQQRCT